MKYTENQIITAMQGTGGIVSQIMQNLLKLDNNGISRQALHERISKNETLKEAYVAEQERIGDIAETGFVRALQKEEEWAIKEWLKFKGSNRGYTQKLEQNTSINIFAEVLAKYGTTIEGVVNEVPRPIEIAERSSENSA